MEINIAILVAAKPALRASVRDRGKPEVTYFNQLKCDEPSTGVLAGGAGTAWQHSPPRHRGDRPP